MPIIAFVGLALAVFIFTGGFASARLYMEAGGAPADVVALRYGVSGLLFMPFVFRARHRISANPGWWRAAAIALGGGAPFGICIFIGVSGAPFTHGGGIVPGLALVLGTLLQGTLGLLALVAWLRIRRKKRLRLQMMAMQEELEELTHQGPPPEA